QRARVAEQRARSSRIAIPKHVGCGNLDAHAVFRELEALGLADDLLQQRNRFSFELLFFFLLLSCVRRRLRGRGRLGGGVLRKQRRRERKNKSGRNEGTGKLTNGHDFYLKKRN